MSYSDGIDKLTCWVSNITLASSGNASTVWWVTDETSCVNGIIVETPNSDFSKSLNSWATEESSSFDNVDSVSWRFNGETSYSAGIGSITWEASNGPSAFGSFSSILLIVPDKISCSVFGSSLSWQIFLKTLVSSCFGWIIWWVFVETSVSDDIWAIIWEAAINFPVSDFVGLTTWWALDDSVISIGCKTW